MSDYPCDAGNSPQGCGDAPAERERSEEYHRSFRDGGKPAFQQSILQPAHEGVVGEIHAVSVVAEAVQCAVARLCESVRAAQCDSEPAAVNCALVIGCSYRINSKFWLDCRQPLPQSLLSSVCPLYTTKGLCRLMSDRNTSLVPGPQHCAFPARRVPRETNLPLEPFVSRRRISGLHSREDL